MLIRLFLFGEITTMTVDTLLRDVTHLRNRARQACAVKVVLQANDMIDALREMQLAVAADNERPAPPSMPSHMLGRRIQPVPRRSRSALSMFTEGRVDASVRYARGEDDKADERDEHDQDEQNDFESFRAALPEAQPWIRPLTSFGR